MSKKIVLQQKLSERDKKKAFSDKTTGKIVQVMESAIKNKRVKKEAVSIIRALDLKKIRNTSKT